MRSSPPTGLKLDRTGRPVLTRSHDLSQFSFTRAIHNAISGDRDPRNPVLESGFEREVSDELTKRYTDLPSATFYAPVTALMGRGLSATNFVQGGAFVQTDLDDVIPALRPVSIAVANGAAVMGDLSGNLAMPRWAALATAGFLNELGTTPVPDIATGQILLTPKRLSCATSVSATLLAQTSGGVESWIKSELLRAIGSALDKACFVGAGAGGEPLGVFSTAGVGSQTFGGAVTFDALLAMEETLFGAGTPMENIIAVTSHNSRRKLRQKLRGSSTAKFLWDDDQELIGYPAYASAYLLGNDKLALFNCPALRIGMWGPAAITVDAYTQAAQGLVRIFCDVFADTALRRVGEAVVSTDAANS